MEKLYVFLMKWQLKSCKEITRPGVTLTNFWQSKTTPTEYDGSEETLGGPFILHPPKKWFNF